MYLGKVLLIVTELSTTVFVKQPLAKPVGLLTSGKLDGVGPVHNIIEHFIYGILVLGP